MPKNNESNQKPRPLQRLSLYFFNRPRRTAILCLALVFFGIASYTTLLKREGFPAIETPFAASQGTYLVNDPAKVDQEAARPLSEFLLEQDGVKSIQTQSFNNFFTAIVSYEESVDAEKRSNELQTAIDQRNILPEQSRSKLEAFKFGYTERGDDLVISFYSEQLVDYDVLIAKAAEAAEIIKNKDLPLVEDASIINPYQTARNPITGQEELAQKSFERYGKRGNNQNQFYQSVVIGIQAVENIDRLEFDEQVRIVVEEINSSSSFDGYQATISASDAPQINTQISELQSTLLEGLLAVLIVGSIVIAIRASIITVLSMVTVIAITNGLLYAIGYSLNTITLFALILGLSLIVDDTIIMVEALDAQRKKRKDPKKAVSEATRKISRAMIAATFTAALSFTPLIFVGGILGSFIRAIPVTIISALFISLIVALVFIPLYARFFLLGRKQIGEENVHEISAGLEAKIAKFISRPMIWAKDSRKRLIAVCLSAIIFSFAFIGAGAYMFQLVTFNIFPSAKDANQLSVNITFPPSTDIAGAQTIASDIEKIAAETIGENFVQGAYYGQANTQNAIINIELTDYKDRGIRAPELVDKLSAKFKQFNGATVSVNQLDAGPPPSAFTARVDSSQNRESAIRLANDIASFLKSVELTRLDGSTAATDTVTSPNPSVYTRNDDQEYVSVSATYEDTDTTTLVTLTQTAVEKEFPKEKVASYGVGENALSFNFGQETENQDSFKTLALAFPAVLAVIYVLLAFQFKSFLQPILIFMAIPFSLFGITLGLYVTDNALSFFAMLGFFALIGLSIKNTILLTDYANQARREGMRPVDAMHEALAERFRPLIATSLTAVVSLVPLALTSPFWEGLAVVLIFGLLSSTFLVVTAFPYYYLTAEFIRSKVSILNFVTWLAISFAIGFPLYQVMAPLAIIAPIAAVTAIIIFKKYRYA